MRVVRSLDELAEPLPSPVLTIGNFDGVHQGHQRILKRVVKEARLRRGTAIVLTFDPHPVKVLAPQAVLPLLTTPEQKLKLLEAAGLELVLVLPFTQELAHLSPRAFVDEIVCRRLRVQVLCVGPSFRFGYEQAGDTAVLDGLAREFGLALHIIPPVVLRGQVTSSSLIRRLVIEGEVAQAARRLGRPFALTGKIQPGAGRGRPLGFPTLNMVPEQECLPARGVYVTETLFEGCAFPSATNVGVRPTFGGQQLLVESHLLDFSGDIAGGRLEVRFHRRLRSEQKFPSLQALRSQIQRDVEHARQFFARERKARAQEARRVSAT